ncbi:hypothetical protein D3C87_1088710 [compost metagenome]
MELQSTTILPCEPFRPSATPSAPGAPNSTFSTSGVSGTMMKMMSALRATSAAEPQMVAFETKGSGVLPCVFTKSSWPASSRWPAMGAPMMPRPMNPIFCAVAAVVMSLFPS